MATEEEDNKLFRDWAEKLARAAIAYQDKTFRQLVDERIINSWAEYVIKNKYP